MDMESLGGIAGGGVLAAVCYKLIGLVESSLKKRNGNGQPMGSGCAGTMEKMVGALQDVATNQAQTAEALKHCLEQVREVKAVTHEIRTAQEIATALENERSRTR